MAANYVKDDQGGTFIPASQRPDGTWRKPRRVKDGYVPQEEVPLYESKGKQFQKNKPTHPVGMSEEYIAARQAARNEFVATKTNPIPGLIIDVTETKKKKKKSKSKEVSSITEGIAKTVISTNTSNEKPKIKAELPAKQVSTTDPLKRLKNLRKKIREIESLDKKIKSGEIKQPDKEMLEKVSKKSEIEQEIKVLERNQ